MAWVGGERRRRRERRRKRGRVVNGERRAMEGVERRRASGEYKCAVYGLVGYQAQRGQI